MATFQHCPIIIFLSRNLWICINPSYPHLLKLSQPLCSKRLIWVFALLSLFGCLTINLLFSAKFWCLGIWNLVSLSLSGQQAHLSMYSRYYYTFTLTRLPLKLYTHPDSLINNDFKIIEHLMKIINHICYPCWKLFYLG